MYFRKIYWRHILYSIIVSLYFSIVFIGYCPTCFAAQQIDTFEQLWLEKTGKPYPIISFPGKKLSLVRRGMKVFLLTSTGENFLGTLGIDEVPDQYENGPYDVRVGDIDYDGNPEFFLKTMDGSSGASYYLVDSKGDESIEKRIFSGDPPIIQNPQFHKDKKELSLFYTLSRVLPLFAYQDIYSYENYSYIYNRSYVYGICFTKEISINNKTNKSVFISESGKNTIVKAKIHDYNDAQLLTKERKEIEGKTIKAGSIVTIVNMRIKNGRVLSLVKDASGNLLGWVGSGAFTEMSCSDE